MFDPLLHKESETPHSRKPLIAANPSALASNSSVKPDLAKAARRDLTPEATMQACDRLMPGFAEVMRRVSLQQVPTAMLSRQVAGLRGKALIVNLPGKPASIRLSLTAIFPALPYCLDLTGAAQDRSRNRRGFQAAADLIPLSGVRSWPQCRNVAQFRCRLSSATAFARSFCSVCFMAGSRSWYGARCSAMA